MPYGIVMGAISLAGGASKNRAAGSAADAAMAGDIAGVLYATNEQKAAYRKAKKLYAPMQEQGQKDAADFYDKLESGYFDPGEFKHTYEKSPGYDFASQNALRNMENRRAAGGKYFSGETAMEASGIQQDLASRDFQSSFNRSLNNYQQNALNKASEFERGLAGTTRAYATDNALAGLRGGFGSGMSAITDAGFSAIGGVRDWESGMKNEIFNQTAEGIAGAAGNRR